MKNSSEIGRKNVQVCVSVSTCVSKLKIECACLCVGVCERMSVRERGNVLKMASSPAV